jgi:hypothetical protein
MAQGIEYLRAGHDAIVPLQLALLRSQSQAAGTMQA